MCAAVIFNAPLEQMYKQLVALFGAGTKKKRIFLYEPLSSDLCFSHSGVGESNNTVWKKVEK